MDEKTNIVTRSIRFSFNQLVLKLSILCSHIRDNLSCNIYLLPEPLCLFFGYFIMCFDLIDVSQSRSSSNIGFFIHVTNRQESNVRFKMLTILASLLAVVIIVSAKLYFEH